MNALCPHIVSEAPTRCGPGDAGFYVLPHLFTSLEAVLIISPSVFTQNIIETYEYKAAQSNQDIGWCTEILKKTEVHLLLS